MRDARRLVAVAACLSLLVVVTPAGATHGSPAEPDFHCQWSLLNLGHTANSCVDSGTRGADIQAQEAWALAATTGLQRPAVIGIMETGVDITHPDLADQLWVNPGEDGLDANGVSKRHNGIDDDANGYVDDVHGWNFANNNNIFPSGQHGTFVSSIAAADGDNGIGMAGVAGLDGQAKLMMLIRPSGTQGHRYAEVFDYARQNGADVVNASHAAPESPVNHYLAAWTNTVTIDAAKRATEAGVVLVLAAAYGSSLAYQPDGWDAYDFPGVLRVHASNFQGTRATGQDVGRTRIEIAAPGTAVYGATPGGGYAFGGDPSDGATSYSAPHVAGAVALIKSVYPNLHGHKAAQAIIEGADLDPSFTLANKAGGRLNAYKALVRAGQL